MAGLLTTLIETLAFLVGSACLVRGAWLIHPAAGWIVLGSLFCAYSFFPKRSTANKPAVKMEQ